MADFLGMVLICAFLMLGAVSAYCLVTGATLIDLPGGGSYGGSSGEYPGAGGNVY